MEFEKLQNLPAGKMNLPEAGIAVSSRKAAHIRSSHREARYHEISMRRSLIVSFTETPAAAVRADAPRRFCTGAPPEEFSCQKNWLFQRCRTKRASPFWKMGTFVKSTSSGKRNLH
jgi:hypothetical protein